jgi:hypothetical protein
MFLSRSSSHPAEELDNARSCPVPGSATLIFTAPMINVTVSCRCGWLCSASTMWMAWTWPCHPYRYGAREWGWEVAVNATVSALKHGFQLPSMARCIEIVFIAGSGTQAYCGIQYTRGMRKHYILRRVLGGGGDQHKFTTSQVSGCLAGGDDVALQFAVLCCAVPVVRLQIMINSYAGLKDQEARQHLGSFGLSGPLALQPMYTLSGGQKSRVALAKVCVVCVDRGSTWIHACSLASSC